MTDIFNAIGNFFLCLFKGIDKLGNTPNVILIIIAAIAMCIWIWRMGVYNKEAEERGSLK